MWSPKASQCHQGVIVTRVTTSLLDAWGSPERPQCLASSIGDRHLKVRGKRIPMPLCAEGTEKICWTRTLTGPGLLVPICHALRLCLQLLRSQEFLSQPHSSCLHISERSVTILPQDLEHAKTLKCHSSAPGWSLALMAAQVLPEAEWAVL